VTMIDTVAHERTARIVSRITQANATNKEAELKPLLPLFNSMAVAVEDVLRVYSTGPVKCSVSTLGTENVKSAELVLEGRRYRSSSGNLTVCLRSERAFDAMLCEVCFGGTGSQVEDADEKDRPASRIETFLRKMVFDAVLQKLPAVLLEVEKSAFNLLEPEEGQPKISDQSQVLCVKASFLVNVFSISAEIEVLLPATEVEQVLGHARLDRPRDKRSLGQVLGDCSFKVVVALPPLEIGLSEILKLSVGSMLKLSSTPSDLSHLTVEGVIIGKGRLSISTDRLGVTVQ
jgi:flagellar motor switch protein FliM